MNAVPVLLITLLFFVLGYRFYSRYLSNSLFETHREASKTPAHEQRDNVDFLPTRKSVLFGHHFSSIAGAAPILGPAIAVIWGWIPALLWVIFGTVLMGAAHDFGCLVASMKFRGQSIGGFAEEVLGPQIRRLFLLVIFFLVWMVIAVFALVIANLFISYPSSVLPVHFEIIAAVLIGFFINRRGGGRLLWPSVLAQVSLLFMIYLGSQLPFSLGEWFPENQIYLWIVFLLFYSLIASILPVWVLLQPRDYINSHQLFLGLGAMILGVLILQPEIVAPAFQPRPKGAPPWLPFLFITIACGAISGFHGLVSSGTTSKQVAHWKDTRFIGYGGMLGEATLALLATLAVSAGFQTRTHWLNHYSSWSDANGLRMKLEAFVSGSARFLEALGIPPDFSQTAMAVLIISFAATSLDTATRIQRYVITEIGESFGVTYFRNRIFASLFAVGSAALLIFQRDKGQGGLAIWPLFGATNQMLAGLSLSILSVYLLKNHKNPSAYLFPAIFVVAVTSAGLVFNISGFMRLENDFLAVLALILFFVQIWIIFESTKAFLRLRREKMKVGKA
jgi:carbon starvation protein